jgi:uncharacterized protein YwqG
MFENLTTLRKMIREFGLRRHEKRIIQLAQPAIQVSRTAVNDDDIPLGASKFGGQPDFPVDFQLDLDGKAPLTFIAQIKFSELYPFDINHELPSRGILYYFHSRQGFLKHDISDRKQWHIIFVEDEATPLVRASFTPSRNEDIETILPAHRMSFEQHYTLPRIMFWMPPRFEINLSEAEDEAYVEMLDAATPHLRHQILGYPLPIQNPKRCRVGGRHSQGGRTVKKLGLE